MPNAHLTAGMRREGGRHQDPSIPEGPQSAPGLPTGCQMRHGLWGHLSSHSHGVSQASLSGSGVHSRPSYRLGQGGRQVLLAQVGGMEGAESQGPQEGAGETQGQNPSSWCGFTRWRWGDTRACGTLGSHHKNRDIRTFSGDTSEEAR